MGGCGPEMTESQNRRSENHAENHAGVMTVQNHAENHEITRRHQNRRSENHTQITRTNRRHNSAKITRPYTAYRPYGRDLGECLEVCVDRAHWRETTVDHTNPSGSHTPCQWAANAAATPPATNNHPSHRKENGR